MIKYLGSKRVLVPRLVETITALPNVHRVLDVFSGTARVGHALKGAGFEVFANDHNAYAHTLAQCYVQADRPRVEAQAQTIIRELQALSPRPGYFTATFCERSRFFQPKNGARIDAMRDHIETLDLSPEVRAVVLVSLMEAADRVDSTTGVQMAYLKRWAPRAHNDIALRMPDVRPGIGHASLAEAADFVAEHPADVAYLDPPYNQHSYLGNYHIWETLVRWDAPETYGIACKRIDRKQRSSPFNSKRACADAMRDVVQKLNVRYAVVSFNNEGYISRDDMESILGEVGEVEVQAIEHDRYVGARIGIYNRSGQKVGKVGPLKNVEYLFTVRVS